MKRSNKFDPFKELVLDKYEKEIEQALDSEEIARDPNFKETKKMFEEAAKHYLELQKTKSITLRVKNEDLIKVKAKAKRSRLPYQRLISALIHKYAEGEAKITF